jgi:hypothetical protein
LNGTTTAIVAFRLKSATAGGIAVLLTIAIVLIVLWLLGLVTSYTLGGLLHILLVIAVIFLLIGLIRGRNVV